MTAPAGNSAAAIRGMFLEAAGLPLDRLPMLNVIFERLATGCADGLRHLTPSQTYHSLSKIESVRIGDVLESYEGNAIAAIFHAPAWDNHVVIGFDRDFIFTVVEVLFGGDGSEPPSGEERAFSPIELRIAQTLFELTARALQASFALVTNTQFKFERLETRMDLAVIGRRTDMVVTAKFLLQAIERGGEMFVVIPQSALTPMRQALSRVPASEPSNRDPSWRRQIRSEVQRTEVTLRAILEERQMTLGEIGELQVGQVMMLDVTPQSTVKVESNDQALFWCQLGQSNGTYKLRIEDVIDQEQEFIDHVISR